MARATQHAKEAVAAFNQANPVGTVVRYWLGRKDGADNGTGEGRTSTPAALLGDHTPVVWIEGVAGCVALSHVERVHE